MSYQVIVTGLPVTVSEDAVRDFFIRVGDVEEVEIKDTETVICFRTKQDMEEALQISGVEFDDESIIKVHRANRESHLTDNATVDNNNSNTHSDLEHTFDIKEKHENEYNNNSFNKNDKNDKRYHDSYSDNEVNREATEIISNSSYHRENDGHNDNDYNRKGNDNDNEEEHVTKHYNNDNTNITTTEEDRRKAAQISRLVPEKNKIIVKHMSMSTTEEELRELFKFCGDIFDFYLAPGCHHAYIGFGESSGVDEALKLNGTKLNGVEIVVESKCIRPLSKREVFNSNSNNYNNYNHDNSSSRRYAEDEMRRKKERIGYQGKSDAEADNRIIVKNLPPDFTEEEVRDLLRGCGTIIDFYPNHEKCYSFIAFESASAVPLALNRDGAEIRGVEVTVQRRVLTRCGKCNNEGHTAHQCTAIVSSIQCRRCNRLGHMARDCQVNAPDYVYPHRSRSITSTLLPPPPPPPPPLSHSVSVAATLVPPQHVERISQRRPERGENRERSNRPPEYRESVRLAASTASSREKNLPLPPPPPPAYNSRVIPASSERHTRERQPIRSYSSNADERRRREDNDKDDNDNNNEDGIKKEDVNKRHNNGVESEPEEQEYHTELETRVRRSRRHYSEYDDNAVNVDEEIVNTTYRRADKRTLRNRNGSASSYSHTSSSNASYNSSRSNSYNSKRRGATKRRRRIEENDVMKDNSRKHDSDRYNIIDGNDKYTALRKLDTAQTGSIRNEREKERHHSHEHSFSHREQSNKLEKPPSHKEHHYHHRSHNNNSTTTNNNYYDDYNLHDNDNNINNNNNHEVKRDSKDAREYHTNYNANDRYKDMKSVMRSSTCSVNINNESRNRDRSDNTRDGANRFRSNAATAATAAVPPLYSSSASISKTAQNALEQRCTRDSVAVRRRGRSLEREYRTSSNANEQGYEARNHNRNRSRSRSPPRTRQRNAPSRY